jgi:hypothetical protein
MDTDVFWKSGVRRKGRIMNYARINNKICVNLRSSAANNGWNVTFPFRRVNAAVQTGGRSRSDGWSQPFRRVVAAVQTGGRQTGNFTGYKAVAPAQVTGIIGHGSWRMIHLKKNSKDEKIGGA